MQFSQQKKRFSSFNFSFKNFFLSRGNEDSMLTIIRQVDDSIHCHIYGRKHLIYSMHLAIKIATRLQRQFDRAIFFAKEKKKLKARFPQGD